MHHNFFFIAGLPSLPLFLFFYIAFNIRHTRTPFTRFYLYSEFSESACLFLSVEVREHLSEPGDHLSGRSDHSSATLGWPSATLGQRPEKPSVFRVRFARQIPEEAPAQASLAVVSSGTWLCPLRTLYHTSFSMVIKFFVLS